jgi:hypothetical protein
MRVRPLTLTAITRQDRYQALGDANSAISHAGGWLISHTLFSNIAATLRCELPLSGLSIFRDSLDGAAIRLDHDSLHHIDSKSESGESPDTEVPLILSITFLHNQPDLRQEVPAVPG